MLCVYGIFNLWCLLIDFIIPNLSRIYFVYQKSLKRTFKTSFWVQIHLLNLCSSAVNPKGYYVVKKLVWNVRIKAFWYTKDIALYNHLKSLHTNINCILMLRYEPSANDMLRVRRVPGSEFLGKRSGYNPSKYFNQIC